MTTFRLATVADIPAICDIYDKIMTDENKIRFVGWRRGIYPTADTARTAIDLGDMYVQCADDGTVLAAARLNHHQDDFYADGRWETTAAAQTPEDVLVIHTLVADHTCGQKGLGKAFVDFYHAEAKRRGCRFLRLDTSLSNTPARGLYAACGFREAGTTGGDFRNIAGLNLVLLEKALD